MTDDRRETILVFVPMYNCAAQIPRVIAQFDRAADWPFDVALLCVDNRSTDDTLRVAEAALEASPVREKYLLQNDENYGLGGSHKVAIDHAATHGFAVFVVLHGDDQGGFRDIAPYIEDGTHHRLDALLGARFMPGATLQGYSRLRTAANHVFNLIFSGIARHRLHDLGSGLNLFRTAIFADGFERRYADNLTFNYYLIFGLADRNLRYRFFPIHWREDDQVSNAKLFSQGVQMLKLLRQRLLAPRRFHADDHRAVPRDAYPATVIRTWT